LFIRSLKTHSFTNKKINNRINNDTEEIRRKKTIVEKEKQTKQTKHLDVQQKKEKTDR